jgi:hypothetical protein
MTFAQASRTLASIEVEDTCSLAAMLTQKGSSKAATWFRSEVRKELRARHRELAAVLNGTWTLENDSRLEGSAE